MNTHPPRAVTRECYSTLPSKAPGSIPARCALTYTAQPLAAPACCRPESVMVELGQAMACAMAGLVAGRGQERHTP